MDAPANTEYIFRSYNIYFQCYAFGFKTFHMPVRKMRQKGLQVSDFALLLSFSSDSMAVKGLISLMVSLDVKHLERKKKEGGHNFFFQFLIQKKYCYENTLNLSAYIYP